jgi:nucleoside-diphosphate-sugar epimerase
MMRELRDVKYVWDEPIELDDTKLRDELGAPPHTPLEEAVRCALEGLEDAFTG